MARARDPTSPIPVGLRYEILDITTGDRTVVPAPGASLLHFNVRGQIAATRVGAAASLATVVTVQPTFAG